MIDIICIIWQAKFDLISWFLFIFLNNQCTEKLLTTCFHKFPNSEFLHILINIQWKSCLFNWFFFRQEQSDCLRIWKIFGILEFVNPCGEHLKLNFKINDNDCMNCNSSFCPCWQGCWGYNYNILLGFCILHPLKDSRDQTSNSLIHYFTNFLFALLFKKCFLLPS